jgi:hypothetical protein
MSNLLTLGSTAGMGLAISCWQFSTNFADGQLLLGQI